MSSITGRSAAPAGDLPLDTRVCGQVGAACREVRTARGLTLAEVGERLLLSTRQVRALEDVDLSAFHNPAFFVAALRKYAGFTGVDRSVLDRLMPPARPAVAAASDGPAVPARTVPDSGARRGLALVVLSAAAVVLAVAVAARGGYSWWQNLRPAAQASAPAASSPPTSGAPSLDPARVVAGAAIPQPSAAPEAAQADPAPAADLAGASTALGTASAAPLQPSEVGAPFGSVYVPRRTWMFLRYIDNSVVERPLADGERAVFEKPPVYLAVGSPDAELTLGQQRVNTAPFIIQGQLRLRASDFNALAANEPAPLVPSDALR